MANQPHFGSSFATERSILQFPEDCRSYARTFNPDDAAAVAVDGRKLIKAGTVYPKNDATAKGVVLYTVDVTDGAASGAIMYAGAINTNRLPAAVEAAAKAVLPRITLF